MNRAHLISAFAIGIAVMLRACTVCAQASTFRELQPQVPPSQTLLVTDDHGRTVRGRLVTLSDQTLTLEVKPTAAHPDGSVAFRSSDVTRIRRADSVVNGMLIGLAAGLGGMAIFTREACGPNDPECAAIANPIGLVTFVPGGMVVGALIDRAINKTILLNPPARATLSVAPSLRPGGAGLTVTMRF